MKKLLVFLLVLGMTSTVQAGFILSADGQTDMSETTLDGPPSYIELGIHIEMGTVFNGGNFDIQLSNAQGSLDYANISFPPATMIEKGVAAGEWIPYDDKGLAGGYAPVPATSSDQNVIITGGDITWNATNNLDRYGGPWIGYLQPVEANSYPVLMEGLMFHCEEEADVTISLVASGQGITRLDFNMETGALLGQSVIYEPGTILDTITVHQILLNR